MLNGLFEKIWDDYSSFNPHAKRVYELILKAEQAIDPSVRSVTNDHVAYRTYDTAPVNMDALGTIFEEHGYKKCNPYVFHDKNLLAHHWEHADETLPKVFISELETRKFSPFLQDVVHTSVRAVAAEDLHTDGFLWSRRPWAASHSIYQRLLQESEYAAWLYAFGFRANHFTISVNALKSFKDLEALNAFVKQNGYALNTAGGEIKGVPRDLLEQSSTLAEKAHVTFQEGSFEIPSCYYEFARRWPDSNGNLYRGFLAANADKIFESTNARR